MKIILSALVALLLLSSGAAAKVQGQDWKTCGFMGN